MSLGSHHPGMIANFNDLNQVAIRRVPADDQPPFFQDTAKSVVKLKAMAVTFVNLGTVVRRGRFGPGDHGARIYPQPHRPTLGFNVSLLGKQIDHGIPGIGRELRRIGLTGGKNMPGVFNHHHMHPEAKPQVGHTVFPGIACGLDLALNATVAKAGPFTYSTVVFSAILGVVFWGEMFDIWNLIGTLLVILGGVLALRIKGGE